MLAQFVEKAQAVLQDDVALEVADSVANKTTITGSGVTILGGLAMNEWAILAGVVLGTAGLLAELWLKRTRVKQQADYDRHKLKLQEEYNQQRLKLLEDQLKCERGKTDETD